MSVDPEKPRPLHIVFTGILPRGLFREVTNAIQPGSQASNNGESDPQHAYHHDRSCGVIQDLIQPMERNPFKTPERGGKQCAGQRQLGAGSSPQTPADRDHCESHHEQKYRHRYGLRHAPQAIDAHRHRFLHPELMQLPSQIQCHIYQQAKLHRGQYRKQAISREALSIEQPTRHACRQRGRIGNQPCQARRRKPILSYDHSLWCTL